MSPPAGGGEAAGAALAAALAAGCCSFGIRYVLISSFWQPGASPRTSASKEGGKAFIRDG
jgi:hypothetical protein